RSTSGSPVLRWPRRGCLRRWTLERVTARRKARAWATTKATFVSGSTAPPEIRRSTLASEYPLQQRSCDRRKPSLPVRPGRTYFDRPTKTRCRDPRCYFDSCIEVVSFEHVVASDGALGVNERAIGCLRVAILHSDGGCVFGQPKRRARIDARRIVDC